MKKKSISFLLFSYILTPGGGIKVILEYANRLAKDGYDVHIVYPVSIDWKERSLYYKLKCVYHYFKRLIYGYSCRSWFDVDPRVKEHLTWSLNYRHVPKTDMYFATEVRTAPYLNEYPIPSLNKGYLIQGYENWIVEDQKVRATYHYPMKKIAITDWLRDIITGEEGCACTVIKDGFDFEYFQCIAPPEERDRYTLSMLYHTQEKKDCKTAYAAIDIVKKKYPQLRVLIFGDTPTPTQCPDWYEYYHRPDRERHNWINNTAAIYIGTSKLEGFGLTVGEAMICGQAVACTNNKGYLEMANDGVNALVSQIEDPEALAANILRLIEDDGLRIRIARRSMRDIRKFSWDDSYEKFKAVVEAE